MTQALHTAPVCEKHGCEKVWHKNKTKTNGGQWDCNQCMNEARRLRTGAKPHARIPKSGPPPTCETHGCKKIWHNHKNDRLGGRWTCKKCAKERSLKWLVSNPEVAKEHSKKSSKGWDQRNPKKAQALRSGCQHRHRALKRNATVPGQPVTAAAIAERLALFDGCAYCGADEKLTVDHFVALNDGGLHVASNLVELVDAATAARRTSPLRSGSDLSPSSLLNDFNS